MKKRQFMFAASAVVAHVASVLPSVASAQSAMKSAAGNSAASMVRFHSPTAGPAGAKVTIVEFFDPACEACRAFYPHVKAVLAENPAQVRLVLRYAAFHKDSDVVVKILEAAKMQGLYWQALEETLKTQPAWADHRKPQMQSLWEILRPIGLDVERARRDSASPRIAESLKQDMADGVSLQVERTPTFYVNGKPLATASPDALRALVKQEIKASYP